MLELDVTIAGVSITATIDTGSTVTLMQADVFDQLQRADPSIRLNPESDDALPINCSNGSTQQVLGRAQLTVKSGPIEMTGDILVVRIQPVPLLIGSDILIASGAAIDYKLRRLLVEAASCFHNEKKGAHAYYPLAVQQPAHTDTGLADIVYAADCYARPHTETLSAPGTVIYQRARTLGKRRTAATANI